MATNPGAAGKLRPPSHLLSNLWALPGGHEARIANTFTREGKSPASSLGWVLKEEKISVLGDLSPGHANGLNVCVPHNLCVKV